MKANMRLQGLHLNFPEESSVEDTIVRCSHAIVGVLIWVGIFWGIQTNLNIHGSSRFPSHEVLPLVQPNLCCGCLKMYTFNIVLFIYTTHSIFRKTG